jgi:HEAT repeat protein
VLSSETDVVFREEAVEALHGVDEPEVVAALTKALDDAEPLVRYAAARELLTLYGWPAKLPDPQDMTIRLMSEDAVERESGKSDIRAAIGGRAMVRQ